MNQSNSIKQPQISTQDIAPKEPLNIWNFLTTNSIADSKCPVQGSLRILTNKKALILIGISGAMFIFRNNLIRLF